MRNLLFLVAYPVEDASCRYRINQFVPFLEQAGYRCTVSAFSTPQLFRAMRRKGHLGTKVLHTLYGSARRFRQISDLAKFDIVIIHREAFPFLTPLVEKWILQRHSKVIFSFDDAIYAGHHDVSSLNHPFLYRLKYGRGVDEVIRRSQHIIAGNRLLAEYALQFNPAATVIPTVVDCMQYVYRSPQNDGPMTIGWMGSRSTISYISAIEPALKRLAESYPHIKFKFFGFPEYKLDVPNFSSLPFRVQSEIDDLHSLDIGIMPLPDTDWTRGKCAFKAIQYMAAGIPVVASPVGVTPDLIQDGVNGLLAVSVGEWFEALRRLVTDADLRRRLSVGGRRTVEDSYSLQVWGPRFVSLLDQLSAAGHVSRLGAIDTSNAVSS
jgi:glycosyltransferase involved in cell wall biosynthesis